MRADAVLKQAIEKIGCCGVFRDFSQGTFCSDVLKTFGTIYGHFSFQSDPRSRLPFLYWSFISPRRKTTSFVAPPSSASSQPRSYREWPRVVDTAATVTA